MEKQIVKLEKELAEAIESDTENNNDYKLLLSIPGVGVKSAASLMAELPDIRL